MLQQIFDTFKNIFTKFSIFFMEPNVKFKKLRKDKNLSQLELATNLGVSRSLIADIERGSTGISKKLMSKILTIFDIEAGYFNEQKMTAIDNLKQGNETGGKQGNKDFLIRVGRKERNSVIPFQYYLKMRDLLENKYPELWFLQDYLQQLDKIRNLIDLLEETKLIRNHHIGIGVFSSNQTLKEYIDSGIQAYRELIPYKEILHKFISAGNVFIEELAEIKNEIGLDEDFEDML